MLVRSKKIMKAAQGQDCTLRLPGCNFNAETTVACHVGSRRGMGVKAGDNMVVFGCSDCHRSIDGVHRKTFSNEILRALEETQEILFANGLLSAA